jgi:NitT/TauT family transport system substrate-binding protein
MKNQSLRTLILFLCVIFTVSLANPYTAAQTPMEKFRVAYTVIAPTQLNVWTAKDMGFYAKHGLDVELVLLVGAPLAVTAMLAGETPIVHTGALAVITSNLVGSGSALVAGAINRFPYVLFVTDQIKRVEDHRGKSSV